MVEDDNAERIGWRVAQCGGRRSKPGRDEPTALMAPRTCGVEAAEDCVVGVKHGIRRPEHVDESIPRAREPRGEAVWKVVIARHDEGGSRESVEERLCCLELRGPAPICEIATGDHCLGRQLFTERDERIVELRRLARAAMEVGDVDQACSHRRTRLYTRSMSEQTPEIFDDLYLGLQAGGALRKQRRGEELTEQEQAALGHWQRLSVWRKVVAVGAFALGTFGLGFTLGGLIFGRRRMMR